MSTLHSLVSAGSHIVAQGGTGSFDGSGSATTITTAIRDFVAPIFALILGMVSLSFLFKRQLTQFFQFAVLAVLVGVFFYSGGEIVKNVAAWVSSLFGA